MSLEDFNLGFDATERVEGPLYIQEADLVELAKQIEFAATHALDEDGLRAFARGGYQRLPEVALAAVSQWLECEVRVKPGTPEPHADTALRPGLNRNLA